MFDRSTELFAKAVAEDPNYGEPYAGLAFSHLLNWQTHWTDDWSRSLEAAENNIEFALRKSPRVAFVHHIAAVFFFWKKDLDRSIVEADAAIDLNPNYAHAHSTRGLASIYSGRPLTAVPFIEQAMRLDPASKQHYLHFLGSAYLLAGDYAWLPPHSRSGSSSVRNRSLARLPRRRARPSPRGGRSAAGLARTDGD